MIQYQGGKSQTVVLFDVHVPFRGRKLLSQDFTEFPREYKIRDSHVTARKKWIIFFPNKMT